MEHLNVSFLGCTRCDAEAAHLMLKQTPQLMCIKKKKRMEEILNPKNPNPRRTACGAFVTMTEFKQSLRTGLWSLERQKQSRNHV